jgi:hypothetical protein
MTSFFFFILSVWGLTHILVSSKIMEPLRNWSLIRLPFFGEMLECYQCTSFWCSMAIYFLFNDLKLNSPSLEFLGERISLDFLLFSFIGSGLISFISLIMSILIKKTK